MPGRKWLPTGTNAPVSMLSKISMQFVLRPGSRAMSLSISVIMAVTGRGIHILPRFTPGFWI